MTKLSWDLTEGFDSPQGKLIACLLLILITLACLSPCIWAQWTNWDDPAYVLNNEHITGLDWRKIIELFRVDSRVFDTFTPLTLLSFAIEHELVGIEPMLYHIDNLLLHLFNTVLVFLICHHLSVRGTAAFLIAALFAIHPMHVESVAWISGRKDVLYAFFYLLALLTYIWHQRLNNNNTHRRQWHVWSIIFFLLALLAKPQAITLPLVLPLIDWQMGLRPFKQNWLEKMPYFLLAVIFTFLALNFQNPNELVHWLAQVKLSAKALAYYIFKFFLPIRLSALHPFTAYAKDTMLWYEWIPYIFLIPLLLLTYKHQRFRKPVLFGLTFFFIQILPTLHLIKLNSSLYYERFTYLAYVGLIWGTVLSVETVFKGRIGNNQMLLRSSLLVLVLLGSQSFRHALTWKNSETLWSNVIKQYPHDYFAYGSRANFYHGQKRYELALQDYSSCLNLNDTFALGFSNRAILYQKTESTALARRDLKTAQEIDPSNLLFALQLAKLDRIEGRLAEAKKELRAVLTKNPAQYEALSLLATIAFEEGDYVSAIELYDEIFIERPSQVTALFWKGVSLLKLGSSSEAIQALNVFLTYNPDHAEGLFFRAQAFQLEQRELEMLRDLRSAHRLGYAIPEEYLKLLHQ